MKYKCNKCKDTGIIINGGFMGLEDTECFCKKGKKCRKDREKEIDKILNKPIL